MTQQQPPAANPAEVVLEYQPTDLQGQPIGQKTVIKGKDWEEVARKTIDVNTAAVRAYHQLKTATRTPAKEEVKPATLTVDEEFQAVMELNDPAKARKALRKLTGLDEIEAQLRTSHEATAASNRRAIAFEWMTNHPEFYNCNANGDMLANYLKSNNLAWTLGNLDIAFAMCESILAQSPAVPTAQPIPEAPAPGANPPRRPQAGPGVQPGQFSEPGRPKKPALTKADYMKMALNDRAAWERHRENPALRAAMEKALSS